MDQLVKKFEEIIGNENIYLNELMKYHTSFKIGGPVDIMLLPKNIEQIAGILNFCYKEDINCTIMGNGTNLIVGDNGIRGVVIKLFKNISSFQIDGDKVKAQTGMLLSTLANVAYKNGLSGVEFASGIPGTLGGAIAMNAGAYGGEFKDVVIDVTYVKRDGEIANAKADSLEFGYRTSKIQSEKGIVVEVNLRLYKKDKEGIKELMSELDKKRKDKQPLEMPSAGSVFKRPVGFFAGKLIEDCGLRGYRIGGAQVSDKHCGFIVNTGTATAKDVRDLITYVQNTVKERFDVDLETEVKFVGEI